MLLCNKTLHGADPEQSKENPKQKTPAALSCKFRCSCAGKIPLLRARREGRLKITSPTKLFGVRKLSLAFAGFFALSPLCWARGNVYAYVSSLLRQPVRAHVAINLSRENLAAIGKLGDIPSPPCTGAGISPSRYVNCDTFLLFKCLRQAVEHTSMKIVIRWANELRFNHLREIWERSCFKLKTIGISDNIHEQYNTHRGHL